MKKLLGIAVLIALIAGGYMLYIRSGGIAAAPSAEAPMPKLTSVSTSTETAVYKIDAQYPQFGVPAVDAKIRDVVAQAMESFKQYPANPPDSAVSQNEQIIRFDTVYIGSDVISAALLDSEYTGGAHPNAVVIGINIDPRTGKEISLDDAIAMTGLSFSEIARTSLAKLKAQLGADLIFPDGADAKKENYQTFLVGKDAVTFIFQSYQVAPYSAGQPKVSLPRVK